TADELPPGVGVPLEAGDQLVLQIHYDNVTAPNTTDNSGIRVLVTDEPNSIPAGILWSGVIWLSAINGNNVMHQGTCTLNDPITIFAVFPHMHQVGKAITLEVQRAGETSWTKLV